MQQTANTGGRAWGIRGLVALAAIVLGTLVGFALVGFDVVGQRIDDLTTSPTAPSANPAAADCPSEDRATLVVAAAPEIAPAVRDVARTAASQPATRCVEFDVRGIAPSTVAAALQRGWTESSDGPAPHVWIPTTSTELALAAGGAPVRGMVGDDNPSVARSPSVIAMPQPMADQLGWPDAELSWAGIATLAAADDAWADRGRRGWGPFRPSLVDGVAAEPTVSAVAALTRAAGALPSDDRSDAERFEAQARLLLLERKVEYLGATTTEQLEQLREADDADELLQTASAIPLTEQLVWRYNGGTGAQAPDTPLAVWYPDDGPTDADYPYAVLQVPWADDSTDDAAAALLDVLRSEDGVTRLTEEGFRGRSREATPELIGADGMRPDLAPPEPEPIPARAVGPVVRTWRGLSQTGNLLAVVDVSGSMATTVPGTDASRLALSANGMAAGISLLDPATSAGVWEFSTNLDGRRDHRELISLGPLDGEVRGRSRREAAIAAIRGLRPRDDTGLYDTILASYAHLQERHQPGRVNAVIFFTDGKNDDADGISLQQLRSRLRNLVDPRRNVQFLGVAYGAEADFEVLEAVTAITGGRLYRLQRPEDIRQVFIDVQTGNVG